MIEAIATVPRAVEAIDGPVGQVGTITVEIYNPATAVSMFGPVTTGISEPRPGTYHTVLTFPAPGVYMVRWEVPSVDSTEEEAVVAPLGAPVIGGTGVATVADVASWLRARTKTRGGAEAGTFNPAASPTQDQTRPNAEQVQLLINDFMPTFLAPFGEVPDAPGSDIDAYRRAVNRLGALGTALEVELTYFPEQVASGRSAYDQLKALYDERYRTMLAMLGLDADDDGLLDPGGVEGGFPSYGGFPETAIGMEFPW